MINKRPLILIVLLITILGLQGCSDPSPKGELVTAEIFRDNFNSEILADHWIIGPETKHIRDDKWSLTTNPGYLTLLTQVGDIYEEVNNPINFFAIDVPYENFEVTTHVFIQPEQSLEQAGLMLYNDWDNYARLARIHTSSDHAIKAGLETAANHREVIHNINNSDQVFLRMSKINNQISYNYSIYGEEWIEIYNRSDVKWDNTYVVLYAISPSSKREIEVLFNYIEIQELKWVEKD